MKKTKIVCTLGPATDEISVIKRLIESGMNVARFNFSHGNHEEHKAKLDTLEQAISDLNTPVAKLLDTKGPELRLGLFENPVELKEGTKFVLINEEIIGNASQSTMNYKNLYQDVKPGNTILLNDGLIALLVEEIIGKDIHCQVMNTGEVSNRKSMNVPGVAVNLPSLTEKDVEDIKFGITNNFNYIAASFIRKASDVIAIREILEAGNAGHIKIIAKIENREGIDNFDEILKVADGIMVARGDMGNEIPIEEVPVVQKHFIKKCYRAGKPVITATQMLESMIKNPRPTRAEVSDVANAIFDGTSAIMLSGETAMGKYPVECVQTMTKIAHQVEGNIKYWNRFVKREHDLNKTETEVINYTSCLTAMHMHAKAIIAFTLSGSTARVLAKYRPGIPIYAITPNEDTYLQMALNWGVTPIHIPGVNTLDQAVHVGIDKCKELGLLEKDDVVVLSGGYNDTSNTSCYTLNKVLGGILKI